MRQRQHGHAGRLVKVGVAHHHLTSIENLFEPGLPGPVVTDSCRIRAAEDLPIRTSHAEVRVQGVLGQQLSRQLAACLGILPGHNRDCREHIEKLVGGLETLLVFDSSQLGSQHGIVRSVGCPLAALLCDVVEEHTHGDGQHQQHEQKKTRSQTSEQLD